MQILSKGRKRKLIVAFFVCVGLILSGFVYRINHKEEIEETKQIQIRNELKVYSSLYYENEIYKNKAPEELEEYSSSGIKVTLKELKEYSDSTTNSKCDENDTYVIIYPKNPFGLNDYSIDYVIKY